MPRSFVLITYLFSCLLLSLSRKKATCHSFPISLLSIDCFVYHVNLAMDNNGYPTFCTSFYLLPLNRLSLLKGSVFLYFYLWSATFAFYTKIERRETLSWKADFEIFTACDPKHQFPVCISESDTFIIYAKDEFSAKLYYNIT